ncbi:hypothetical protein [Flavobacterium sp.]|uniref:hypothetical protein n=1 Tax=Flavobacterium sp. TaxID=239 RepID=UPI002FDD3A2E
MKHLLLITVMVFALCPVSKMQGQSAIEIKPLCSDVSELTNDNAENRQFEILAHEDMEVDLNFSLKLEGNVTVSVTDQYNHLVMSKKIKKNDKNPLVFSMAQNQRYIVKVTGEKQTNLIVQLSEK